MSMSSSSWLMMFSLRRQMVTSEVDWRGCFLVDYLELKLDVPFLIIECLMPK